MNNNNRHFGSDSEGLGGRHQKEKKIYSKVDEDEELELNQNA